MLRSFFHKSCPILEPKPVNSQFYSHTFCVSLHLLNKDIDLMHLSIMFYLGYLRGRSFPHKMPSFPPKKLILLSLQYSVTISSLQVTEHTVILLKIVSQNAPNCISAHIHFKNFGEGACPWTTQGSSWPSATRDFSPKR